MIRLALLALFALPGAARAEFAVCNQSYDVVNVAVGQDVAGDMQTEGWWTIGPNQCANVIKDELTSRYVYIYAQDVFGQPILKPAARPQRSAPGAGRPSASSRWRRGRRG